MISSIIDPITCDYVSSGIRADATTPKTIPGTSAKKAATMIPMIATLSVNESRDA
jgi:hypothetical protein